MREIGRPDDAFGSVIEVHSDVKWIDGQGFVLQPLSGGRRPRWREGARIAVLERLGEARCSEVRAPSSRSQCLRFNAAALAATPPLKNGLARLSPAPTPAEERSSRAPQARAAARSREPLTGPSATARGAHRTTAAVSA